MDDGTIHIVTLDQKPCIVHYLEHYNRFLIGTYELFPSIEEARSKLPTPILVNHNDDRLMQETLERINFRAGKFILLRGNDVSVPNIEYDFNCYDGGGIFDAKLRYNNSDSSYKIFAAHSNGTIGIYKLSLHCGNKICLKEHIDVAGSKMLTSIDIFSDLNDNFNANDRRLGQQGQNNNRFGSPLLNVSSNERLVVGDSDGFINVIGQGESIRENVTHNGDSIWQVKSLKLASGRDVVLVGADNCSWYIYGIDEQNKRMILLYKNSFKDFTAGITSISILDVYHSNEYDSVEVLLGSYDETLQTYDLKLNHDGKSKPGVCHKNTMTIKNGGIWRIKPFKGIKRQLCISAMYAGSYTLSLNGAVDRQQTGGNNSDMSDSFNNQRENLVKLIDTDLLKLAHKPLHYDIDISSCNKTYCIVDFNNSLCILKTIDKQQ